MKLQSFTLLLLAPLALAAELVRRDAQSVYDDIVGIDAAVRHLTSTLESYTGGILPSSPVFNASLAIHAVNRQGFADANSPSPFSSADSQRIVSLVSDSVGVSIPASASLLEAKKPLFDAAQLSSVILATINLLKSDHETFSLAVGALLSPDQVVPGLEAAGKIDAVLQEAALFYSL